MTIKRAIFAASATLTLLACSGDPDTAENETSAADDFAARINGAGDAAGDGANNNPPTTGDTPRAVSSPVVAQPLPNAAQGAFAQGTATDPAAATCGANKMGPFIGKVADVRTRVDIEDVAGAGREIRFLRPGGEYVKPDAANPRLNIMLDIQDVIRDARCG